MPLDSLPDIAGPWMGLAWAAAVKPAQSSLTALIACWPCGLLLVWLGALPSDTEHPYDLDSHVLAALQLGSFDLVVGQREGSLVGRAASAMSPARRNSSA